MIVRITFIELALLATPFLLYFLYRAVVGRRRAATGGAVDETPYQILFLSGSAVALASLVVVVLLGHDAPDTSTEIDLIYVPQRIVDGRVEPAQFLSREEAIAQGLIPDVEDDADAPAPASTEPDAPAQAP